MKIRTARISQKRQSLGEMSFESVQERTSPREEKEQNGLLETDFLNNLRVQVSRVGVSLVVSIDGSTTQVEHETQRGKSRQVVVMGD